MRGFRRYDRLLLSSSFIVLVYLLVVCTIYILTPFNPAWTIYLLGIDCARDHGSIWKVGSARVRVWERFTGESGGGSGLPCWDEDEPDVPMKRRGDRNG